MDGMPPEIREKLEHAVGVVMAINPADPIAVLLGEVVAELSSRTDEEMLKNAFHALAFELPWDFLCKAIVDILPEGFVTSIGLNHSMNQPFYGTDDSMHYRASAYDDTPDDVPYIVHAQYHRLGRLLVLLAALQTNVPHNVLRATRLKNYIMNKITDLVIIYSKHTCMYIPGPIMMWIEAEIKILEAHKDKMQMGGDTFEVKRLVVNRLAFQIQDLACFIGTINHDELGWKLLCCKEVMLICKPSELDKAVAKLVANTQDKNLQESFRMLAYELSPEFLNQPIANLLPRRYAHLLGLPSGLDQPFHRMKQTCDLVKPAFPGLISYELCPPKQSFEVNDKYDLSDGHERELFKLHARYHRIGRLIILYASLARSPGNAQSAKSLKEGIYTMLRGCGRMYSNMSGSCMPIPTEIVQWVEQDLKELSEKINEMKDTAAASDTLRLAIDFNDLDVLVHETINYASFSDCNEI